jgi:YD repeat-containing protein
MRLRRVLDFLILLFFSCSKMESNMPPLVPPKTDCRITTASYSGGAFNFTYTLTYNDDGKLSKLVYDGVSAYVKTFTYSGNMIYININGINSATDTITLNSAGLMVAHKETTDTAVYNTSFTYDANGQLISSTTQQDNLPSATTNYTFTNGDLTNTSVNGMKDTTVYDLNKTAVIGNLDDFDQLIYYGSSYYTNRHLKQSFSSWPYHYTFAYTYDDEGKILSVVANDGTANESFMFTYDCK